MGGQGLRYFEEMTMRERKNVASATSVICSGEIQGGARVRRSQGRGTISGLNARILLLLLTPHHGRGGKARGHVESPSLSKPKSLPHTEHFWR